MLVYSDVVVAPPTAAAAAAYGGGGDAPRTGASWTREELASVVEAAVRRAEPPMSHLKALRRVSYPIMFLCVSTSLALIAVGQLQLQDAQTAVSANSARMGYVYSQLGRLNQTTWGLAANVNYLGNSLDTLTQTSDANHLAEAGATDALTTQVQALRDMFVMLIYALQNATTAAHRR